MRAKIDAMSVSQIFNNKWPTLGIPGTEFVDRLFKEHLELLESFETVIICFDGDDPGRKAAVKAAELLSPGRAKIAQLPQGKDCNDVLVEQGPAALQQILFNAKPYRPDGILKGEDLEDSLKGWFEGENRAQCLKIPRSKLCEMTKGLRKGELIMLTAGTGIGKSTEANEWLYALEKTYNFNVGIVALEENTTVSALRYMSIHLDKPLHLLPVDDQGKPEGLTEADFMQAYRETVGNGHYALYDHFGALDSDNLVSKLRYLAVSLECDFILLDHITIATSLETDQLAAVDKLMNNLRSLIEETGVGVIAISHLRKVGNGKGFEAGGAISLDDLKGSGSIKQISDTIIAIERDQQADEEEDQMNQPNESPQVSLHRNDRSG